MFLYKHLFFPRQLIHKYILLSKGCYINPETSASVRYHPSFVKQVDIAAVACSTLVLGIYLVRMSTVLSTVLSDLPSFPLGPPNVKSIFKYAATATFQILIQSAILII
jgi:hypothetical protein